MSPILTTSEIHVSLEKLKRRLIILPYPQAFFFQEYASQLLRRRVRKTIS